MGTFRGFIAIEIPAAPKILEFENEIKKSGADVKLVEPHNIHITLKFLGDTEEKQIDEIHKSIQNAVQHSTPFPITLKGTGVFPNENYLKVVWIGIIDNGIISGIARCIDEQLCNLGFQREKRGFSPHLTIGRVKTARNKHQLLQTIQSFRETEFSSENVRSILLKKSDLTPNGPVYTTVREVSF